MTINTAHSFCKPRSIVDLHAVVILAHVEAKRLFVYIPEEMERLNRNVRAIQLPLEQGPEVLNPVRVYSPVYVVDKMVDDFVDVVSINARYAGCSSVYRIVPASM
jgi:hypothetical protein